MPIRTTRNLQDKISSKLGAADARITGKVKAGLTIVRTRVKNKMNDVKASVKAPLVKKKKQLIGKAKTVLYGGRTRHTVIGNIKGAASSIGIKAKNKIENVNNLKKGYTKAVGQYAVGQIKGKAIETKSALRRKWR